MSGEIRPVAVTGIGIRSPLGSSAAQHWSNVANGARAVRRIGPHELGLPLNLAPGWSDWAGAPPLENTLPCSTITVDGLAMLSAAEALQQAALLHSPRESLLRFGVVVGASKPILSAEPGVPLNGLEWTDPPLMRDDLFALSWPARTVADVFGCGGPLLTPSAACATGLVSIIRGVELVRSGDCDVVIAGSSDSSLHPAYLAAYRRMGVLAPIGVDPSRCCRPFDARRTGFAVGSGAAIVVLEDIDHARRRGATILAEVLGAGMTSDEGSFVDVDPGGDSLARALRDAVTRSGMRASDIAAASLHGTGTRLNDICETNALKKVCGEHAKQISCFSLKGAIGHLMGAAGSVETATLIQAMQHGLVPPTVNLEDPDPDCDLDYTPGQARSRPINLAVKLSLGFGGTCAALVIRRPESPSKRNHGSNG